MISQILQYILISLVLIALVHYFFSFLKTNLTVPKVKDMINMPSKRYKDIIDSIDNKKHIDSASNKMKDELKQYMASLMDSNQNVKVDDTTTIDSLEVTASNEDNSSYSSY